MKSCVFVLPSGFMVGGVTTWSIKMAKYLTKDGLSTTLIRHTDNLSTINDAFLAELVGIKVLNCPGKPPCFSSADELMTYIPTYQSALPGTLIPNITFDTYAACALLAQTEADNMRMIGIGHSDDDGFYTLLQYYEPIIHVFLAVSEDIAIKLRRLIPHRKDDIVVRACGVDVAPHLVRDYSRSQEPIQLLYGGRIVNNQKRVYDLIFLAKALEQKNVNFHLTIAGSGNEEAWLRQQFDSHGFSNSPKITFAGSVPYDQMPDRWKASDICVMVSDFEGTSVSMLEAMAQGCVPVVTRVSGTAQVIREGINGFTVPVGNMEQMAARIQMLDSDRNQLQQAGINAHQTVLKEFSFDQYLRWFRDLNEQVWKQSARPWPVERPVIPVKQPTSLYRRASKKSRKVLLWANYLITRKLRLPLSSL